MGGSGDAMRDQGKSGETFLGVLVFAAGLIPFLLLALL
jgi:hypothetical protein